MSVSEDRIREIVREEIDAYDARSAAYLIANMGKSLENIPDPMSGTAEEVES